MKGKSRATPAAAHTRGPWTLHHFTEHADKGAASYEVHPATDEHGTRTIARVTVEKTIGAKQRKANAALIAAAPDLLAALQQIAALDRNPESSDRDDCAYAQCADIARAAIAKKEAHA